MNARAVFGAMQAATLAARVVARTRSEIGSTHPPPPGEGPCRVLMVGMYPERFAGTRYRLSAWARRLRRQGFEVQLALPMAEHHAVRLSHDWSPAARAEFHLRMLSARLATIGDAGRFHVAVVHLNDLPFWDGGPPFVAAALKRRVGRLVLDLDDLPLVGARSELNRKARALGRLADGLSVGNRMLPDHYQGSPWWYVPTCVEPQEWVVPDRANRTGPPLLGWVGTPGNLRNLAVLAPILGDICRRHDTRLRIVCSQPARLPGVPEEFIQWSAEGEQADLLGIDIGLAPLLDEVKQRYTCGLKALQYMASGTPVVASAVGPLPTIVSHEQTGLLASTPDAWGHALERLMIDRDLRLRLGTAGRGAVEERWSFAVHEPAFLDALRGLRPHG
jgi:glycosyltransferase involved in cell wall biosynthesis